MIGLVIWAYNNCRSTMALYRAIQRQARFPVRIVLSKDNDEGCAIPKLRKHTGFREDEFADVEGDADSLAGLILEIKGEFPSIHKKIDYKNYTFEIYGMEERRISRVKVVVHSVLCANKEEC